MTEETYNVYAKIKHRTSKWKTQPVIEQRRLWLEGFTTRDEAEKFAGLAVDHNKGVVLKAWVEPTSNNGKGDQVRYPEIFPDILLMAAQCDVINAKAKLREMTPDELRNLQQACSLLDEWIDDVTLERHRQKRERKAFDER